MSRIIWGKFRLFFQMSFVVCFEMENDGWWVRKNTKQNKKKYGKNGNEDKYKKKWINRVAIGKFVWNYIEKKLLKKILSISEAGKGADYYE